MSLEKRYEIKEELQFLMLRANALDVMRDAYVRLRLLGYRPATRSATDAEQCRREFWRGVIAAYPQLAGKRLSYCSISGTVHEVKSRSGDCPRRKSCACGMLTPPRQIMEGVREKRGDDAR